MPLPGACGGGAAGTHWAAGRGCRCLSEWGNPGPAQQPAPSCAPSPSRASCTHPGSPSAAGPVGMGGQARMFMHRQLSCARPRHAHAGRRGQASAARVPVPGPQSVSQHRQRRTWPSASSAATAAVMAASGMSLQLWSIALSWPRGGPAAGGDAAEATPAQHGECSLHRGTQAWRTAAAGALAPALPYKAQLGQVASETCNVKAPTGDGDGVRGHLHLGAHQAHHLGKPHVALRGLVRF